MEDDNSVVPLEAAVAVSSPTEAARDPSRSPTSIADGVGGDVCEPELLESPATPGAPQDKSGKPQPVFCIYCSKVMSSEEISTCKRDHVKMMCAEVPVLGALWGWAGMIYLWLKF